MGFNKNIIFKTERLDIRKLISMDLPNYYDMVSNINVMKYVKQPLQYDESKKELSNFIAYYKDKEHFKIWGVNKQSENELIGIYGYYLNDKGEFEIAYRLRTKYWQKGFGFEIAQGLVIYLSHRLKLQKLSAYVMNENIKSIKVLENLGFQRVQFANNKKYVEHKYELNKI